MHNLGFHSGILTRKICRSSKKKNLEQQKKVAWLGFEPKTSRAGPFGPRAPAVVARLKLEKKKKLARVGFEPKASRA
jgi:hypothetical protein